MDDPALCRCVVPFESLFNIPADTSIAYPAVIIREQFLCESMSSLCAGFQPSRCVQPQFCSRILLQVKEFAHEQRINIRQTVSMQLKRLFKCKPTYDSGKAFSEVETVACAEFEEGLEFFPLIDRNGHIADSQAPQANYALSKYGWLLLKESVYIITHNDPFPQRC